MHAFLSNTLPTHILPSHQSFKKPIILFMAMSLFISPISFSQKTTTDHSQIIQPTNQFEKAEAYEALPAGALTYKKIINANAFSHASDNMNFERKLDFTLGNALFKKIWVSSPSSTESSDGLGPLFNARACQRCHIKDGRGHPPSDANDNRVSMLLRLGIPPQNVEQKETISKLLENTIPEPTYGGQLQDHSVAAVYAEGGFVIDYTETTVKLNGGESISLRKPRYTLTNLRYGNIHQDTMVSPRIASQMIGLGLLEAIAEKDIIAQADPEDKDNNGISGKAQQVWSRENKKLMLGRFGHKAGMPTLDQQNQAAFNGDIGLATPLFSDAAGDCTTRQVDCQQAPKGLSAQHDNLEVSKKMTDLVLHYTRNLAVPARRKVSDSQVLVGKKLFYSSGCIDCHTPKFITPKKTPAIEQAYQLIWPYTDLLLHDMGDGLADHFTEAKATGKEWRTPPLWGIGLTPTVNGHSLYLHDGRARNLLEAILWHGGEAKTAKNAVIDMTPVERKQLIQFVESL
ncbi:MAG: CxxC motif-containing protein (DUF1111 family) [Candidatus Endobugula sp.]|jgi:CxxC motif-containing protein (DUF1111 family)